MGIFFFFFFGVQGVNTPNVVVDFFSKKGVHIVVVL